MHVAVAGTRRGSQSETRAIAGLAVMGGRPDIFRRSAAEVDRFFIEESHRPHNQRLVLGVILAATRLARPKLMKRGDFAQLNRDCRRPICVEKLSILAASFD